MEKQLEVTLRGRVWLCFESFFKVLHSQHLFDSLVEWLSYSYAFILPDLKGTGGVYQKPRSSSIKVQLLQVWSILYICVPLDRVKQIVLIVRHEGDEPAPMPAEWRLIQSWQRLTAQLLMVPSSQFDELQEEELKRPFVRRFR